MADKLLAGNNKKLMVGAAAAALVVGVAAVAYKRIKASKYQEETPSTYKLLSKEANEVDALLAINIPDAKKQAQQQLEKNLALMR